MFLIQLSGVNTVYFPTQKLTHQQSKGLEERMSIYLL